MAPSANFENDYTQHRDQLPTIEEINEEMMVSKAAAERLVKIVKRSEEAKKSSNLDLSECQLTRIPDEIFDLVKDAKLKSCDLSNNVIRKLPPKFSIEFNLLTDLNLANNEIYKLTDEFAGLTLLVRLDISNNYLLNLPAVLFKLPKLRQLKAHHNAIIDIDGDQIIASDSLELVDLRSNPFTNESYDLLKNACVSFYIDLSPRWIKRDRNLVPRSTFELAITSERETRRME